MRFTEGTGHPETAAFCKATGGFVLQRRASVPPRSHRPQCRRYSSRRQLMTPPGYCFSTPACRSIKITLNLSAPDRPPGMALRDAESEHSFSGHFPRARSLPLVSQGVPAKQQGRELVSVPSGDSFALGHEASAGCLVGAKGLKWDGRVAKDVLGGCRVGGSCPRPRT